MKSKELKPGIYKGSYCLMRIDEVDVRKRKDLPKSEHGWGDPMTTFVRVLKVNAYDIDGVAQWGGYWEIDNKPTEMWVTPQEIKYYLGTPDEVLAQCQEKFDKQRAERAESEAERQRVNSLIEALAEHIGTGKIQVGADRTFHGRRGVYLDEEAATRLVQILDMGVQA